MPIPEPDPETEAKQLFDNISLTMQWLGVKQLRMLNKLSTALAETFSKDYGDWKKFMEKED